MSWRATRSARRNCRLIAFRDQLPVGVLVTADRLAAVMNADKRTIYRYVGKLRQQGVRIDGQAGCGYIRRPQPLPTYYGA